MDIAKMIYALERLCGSMADSNAEFNIGRRLTIQGNPGWYCLFRHENKYGGRVEYYCKGQHLDQLLSEMIDKLDAAGLLGDEQDERR